MNRQSSQALSDVAHNRPEVMQCPYPFYRLLHDNAPVFQDPAGYWIVSSYPLVAKVMRNARLFSSDVLDLTPLPPALREQFVPTKSLLLADPPVHTRHKGLANKALSPARVKRMHQYIEQIVDELIDGFADKGEVDFFAEFAMPLPLAIIADQLGVRRSMGAKFRQWSDAMVLPMSPSTTEEQRLAIVPVLAEMNAYFESILHEKRVTPTEDIISDLATIEIEPIEGVDPPGTPNRRLTNIEAKTIIQLLMVAGNESSTAALCASMDRIARDPSLAAELRAQTERIPAFIEEVLRLDSPLQGFWRLVTEDTELGGVGLPKGSLLFALFAAANRDDEQFESAEEFRLDRTNMQSVMTFGLGIHFCPGSTLARTEIAIALRTLLDRFDSIALAPGGEEPSYFPTTLVRGMTGLNLLLRQKVAA